jgi:hypothetical protein
VESRSIDATLFNPDDAARAILKRSDSRRDGLPGPNEGNISVEHIISYIIIYMYNKNKASWRKPLDSTG